MSTPLAISIVSVKGSLMVVYPAASKAGWLLNVLLCGVVIMTLALVTDVVSSSLMLEAEDPILGVF